jgi:nucleotide-binding universal stress UspA family protein
MRSGARPDSTWSNAGDSGSIGKRRLVMGPIMLATDGSPSAEAATEEALELAQRLELPLLVACVVHGTTPAYGYYGYAEIAAELREIQHNGIAELFAQVKERAVEVGVACETVELDGPVGDELCKLARGRNVRLIVIGAHGWGRIGRLIHGSVSTYVLHHAANPVLVVHAAEERSLNGAAPAATTTTA